MRVLNAMGKLPSENISTIIKLFAKSFLQPNVSVCIPHMQDGGKRRGRGRCTLHYSAFMWDG